MWIKDQRSEPVLIYLPGFNPDIHFVHTPLRGFCNLVLYWTIATVKCIWPWWTFEDDDIENCLGCNSGNISGIYSNGILADGKSCKTSTIVRLTSWL